MRFTFLVGAVLVVATACGGGQTVVTNQPGTPTAAPSVAATCSGSGGSAVSIADFSFIPANVTVSVGGVVTWTNNDSATHTVTFDQGPDCGRLTNPATASRTFDAAGTFAYHCAIHPTMKGSVVVQ